MTDQQSVYSQIKQEEDGLSTKTKAPRKTKYDYFSRDK
jgi:hypothetical protein